VTLPRPDRPDRPLAGPPAPDALDAQRLESDRRLVMTVLKILVVPSVGMAFTDLMISRGDVAAIASSLWIRLLTLGGIVAVYQLMKRATTRREYEQIVFVIATLGSAAVIALQLVRPPDNLTAVRFEMLMVVGFFTALPNRARLQAIPAIALAAASLGILTFRPSRVPVYEIWSSALTFGLAIGLGALVTVRRDLQQRREADALRAEQELRAALEQTMSELRVLKGVLPTCAHCKRIHTDTGEWQQMELYVREHSEAEFSHGVCPDCAAELYPEISRA
jgi:hypothetical protein